MKTFISVTRTRTQHKKYTKYLCVLKSVEVSAELLMSSTDTTEGELLNLNFHGILFLMFKLGPMMHSGDVGHEDAAFS